MRTLEDSSLSCVKNQELSIEADGLQLGHFGIDVPFMHHIGLQTINLDGDCCRTHLKLKRELLNSRGDIHGGALMSALDFTLSVVARAHDPLTIGAATIDMSTHFYAPAKSRIDIVATCKRRGKSIAFCEGEVHDDEGVVLAVARAVFKLVPRIG
ncbi:PaaI family thioesterase [Advenella sp. FME57]|uniref:PaaI family thioesterase n=1 Tax=Advenella sp. FME57 TaxID=2742604 RepID=UPI001867C347|nr:PaaI family thioesterase [Advenella sp. FME57]